MVPGSSLWLAWPVVAGLVLFWQIRRRATWPQTLGAVALCSYALWICSAAFFPLPLAEAATSVGPAELVGRRWVNLVPINDMQRSLRLLPAAQIVRQFGGNFLLFVPFTLFGPMLWPRLRSWRWPLAIGLGGSVAIEALQLALSMVVGYPYRQADIDDVVLNTAGAFAGYALFVLSSRAYSGVRRRSPA